MQQPAGSAALPIEADIEKISAVLREDMTAAVLAEMAERLLQLSAAELHPRLRAALLDRAGSLCGHADPARALSLWLESFRLFPDPPVGRRLAVLAADDPNFARLNRLGHLVDAIAELAPPAQRPDDLAAAAQYHIQQGHGTSAQAALAKLAEIAPHHPQLLELSDVALQQAESRADALQTMRFELANASDDERARLLIGYADMLLHGDEPLNDAAAVLADAVDAGVSPAEIAPMWVEVARAMGDGPQLARALALAIGDESNPLRLQYADELTNLPDIERTEPLAAIAALRLLNAVMPDDVALQSRLAVTEAFAEGVGAEASLEALRLKAMQTRDRVLESAACLALAQIAQTTGDLEKAERHFRRVRSLSPQNPEALDFFEQWYRRAGDHRRLFAALTQRAAQSDGRVLVRIALEMAQLAEGPLAALDPTTATERAIEAYQRVLSVQPDHMDAIAALERLLTAGERWPELAALLARSAHVFAPRAVIDTSARDFAIAIWNRLAALNSDKTRLPDTDAALEARLRVLDLDPRNPDALQAVVATLESTNDWNAVRDMLLTAVEAAEDPHELASLSQQLGEVYRTHLNNPEEAATWLDRAAMSEPDRADARLQAQALWRARGDRDRLLDALMADLRSRWGRHPTEVTLQEALALTPESERETVGAILEEAAQLATTAAGSPFSPQTQSFLGALWSLLVALQPGHLHALDALHALWAQNNSGLLVDLLQTQAALPNLPASRKIAVLERLCPLLASTASNDPETAHAALTAADQLSGLVPDAMLARTTRLHALVALGDIAALRATYAHDDDGAAAFAESVAAVAEQKPLEARVGLLRSAADAIAATGQAGRATELLADALHTAEQMEASDVRQTTIVATAEALLTAARDAGFVGLERLAVETLATHAPVEDLPRYKKMRTALLVSAGLWSDATAAAADWIEELLANGDFADLAEAIAELNEAARRAGELDTVPHRLLAWAEVVPPENDGLALRVKLWLDAANQLLSAGTDLETARHAVDLATEAAPNSPGVLNLRERVCTEQADWPAVVATLERLAELQNGNERLDTLLRAANLCDHALTDPATAAQLYRQVLEETPDALEAWYGLAASLRKAGTLDERADVLDSLLARDDLSRDSRARLALERVELAHQRTEADHAAPAFAVLARLAALLEGDATGVLPLNDSENGLLGVALTQLDDEAHAAQTAELLLPILRSLRNEDTSAQHGLLRCLDTLVATPTATPEAREAWLREAADCAVSDPNRRYAAVRALVERAPDVQNLDELSALAAAAGTDAECNALLTTIATVTQATELRTHAARLLANRGKTARDTAQTISGWTLAHEIEPENPEPLVQLAAMYAEVGDNDGLAFALRQQTTLGDENARIQAWTQLATLKLDTQRDAQGAAIATQEALALHPNDERLWSLHLRALREASDATSLLNGLRARLGQSGLLEETRLSLQREIACLYDDAGDHAAALSVWLKLACDDPNDEDATGRATANVLQLATDGLSDDLASAARALTDVLDLRGDQERLTAVLNLRLAHAVGEERGALLERLVSLREEGDDPAGAFDAAATLFVTQPDAPNALVRLARLAEAAGVPRDRLAATLLSGIDAATLTTRQALREAALGALADDESTLTVRRGLAEAALTDSPDDALWLQRADTWAHDSDDDGARLHLLARRVALAADDATRLALQQERARLADRLGDLAAAQTAWTDVLHHDDPDARREAAASLGDVSERLGDHATESKAWVALRADTEDADARLALSLKAAHAAQVAGNQAEALAILETEALDHPHDTTLYHAIAALLPDGERKTQHLAFGWQQILADDSERLTAADAWLSSHGDDDAGAAWQRLTQVLDVGLRGDDLIARLAQLATASDDTVAIAAGTRLANHAATAQDIPAEIAARQALLSRLDGHAAQAERRVLAALLEQAGEYDDACAHLRVSLAESWDRSVAEHALALASQSAIAETVAEEVAVAAAQGVAVADLTEIQEFTGTAALAEVAARHLLTRLEHTGEASDQAALLHLLLALAHQHGLSQLREHTVDVVSTNPQLAAILSHAQGDPLVAPLRLRAAEQAVQNAGPEGRTAATRQLAELRASVAGDVVGALELLLQRAPDSDPLAALRDAQSLAAAHGRLDLWLDAAENLLMDADLAGEQRTQAATLAAEVAVIQGLPARAAALWQLVWDDDPDSAVAREQVLNHSRRAGDPAPLATAIERAMLLGGDVDRGALRVELADLKRQLGKSREALRLLQDTVASDPDRRDVIRVAEGLLHDPQLLDETLELLERQYRHHEQWPQLASVLQQRMERTHRPTSRVVLAQALATVQQQHGDVASAVAALMTALRAAPSMDGLAAIERLCDAQALPEALVEAYALMQSEELSSEQRETVLRHAIAFDLARGATDHAEAALIALIQLRPEDDTAFGQLSDLLGSIDRREDLMAAWQARIAATPTPARRREGLREIAGLARALGHTDVAIDAAQTWSDLDPDEPAALEVWADLLRELDRPAELAGVLVQLAQVTAEPADRARLLIETARQHEHLGDIDAQQASYEGAFDADPTNDESFVFLERKAGADPERLIPLFSRRSETLASGPSRTLMLRKLANAAAELNDGTTACRALETAIADDPSNTAVLDELLRIAEQQHEWEIWLQTAQKRLAVETRKEGKANLRRQMARVTLTDQIDPVAAAEHIAALEKLAPDDASVAQFKTMLQARSADPREAAAGLEALLKDATDTATQTSLHQQLADLYGGPLDNPGKAIRELVRLVQLDPRRWSARRRLCDLYKARGSMEAYAESLRQWLQTLGDSRDANTLSPERLAQLGALQLELGEALAAVGQVAEAANVLKDALILNGHSVRLDGILAQMLEATSDTAGAAELEDWLVGHHALGDREQMATHAQKAAQLWEQLGDHAKARDAWRRVLEVRVDEPVAMLGQGRACLDLGDTDRALRLFDAVSRNTKASPKLRADALVGMGRCRMSRLALDQARNCYERALQLVPGHRGALDGLSEL